MGAVLSAAGLVLSANTTTPRVLQATEIAVAFGNAGTGCGVNQSARPMTCQHQPQLAHETQGAPVAAEGQPYARWRKIATMASAWRHGRL